MERNAMIWFLIFLVFIIVLLGLELLLSTRRNKWWGLIPMAAAAAIVICLNLSLLEAASSYTVKKLTAEDGGNQFAISLRYDKKGELVDFSDLQVRDKRGTLIDEVYLSFDKSGRLESESDRAIYQETIDRMLDGSKLTGFPAGDAIEKDMIPLGDGLYVSTTSSWVASVLWVVVPMIPVYVIGRLVVRARRRKAELKKLQVEGL
ncbi:hypothetical protein P0G10_01070 [Eubacteriales bacterium DFI.9.88]|nr:hypothetical protein [Eubacteriales bacterium DFI.9.88]